VNAEFFRDLYNYNFWARDRIWSCVEQLTDEQFDADVGYSHGTIRDQCVHVLAVEYWWFEFLRTGTLRFTDAENLDTRAAIRAEWEAVEQNVRAYAESVDDAELQRDVRPDFWDEERQPIKVWQAMLQVANHSTDHRAQVLAGIQRLGGPTVGQDYLDYLFAQQQGED
jgi:uncharacterized damage-inducible protein DinB